MLPLAFFHIIFKNILKIKTELHPFCPPRYLPSSPFHVFWLTLRLIALSHYYYYIFVSVYTVWRPISALDNQQGGSSLGKVNSSRSGPQLPAILGIGKSSMQLFLGETSHLVSLHAPLFLAPGSSTYALFLWVYLHSRYFMWVESYVTVFFHFVQCLWSFSSL